MISQDIKDKTWVIIPAYYEEAVIADIVTIARTHFTNVIVIDDGSQDQTATNAEQAGAIVLRHVLNLGQGAALQTGFEFVAAKKQEGYVVTFDADGQHQIDDVLNMLATLISTQSDITIGSRFKGKTINMPLMKRLILKTCSFWTRFIQKINISDCHNGLRVMTTQCANKLRLQQNGMAHASEIIEKISRLKLKYVEVPVTIHYTEYSKSKGQSLWNGFFILRNIFLQRILK